MHIRCTESKDFLSILVNLYCEPILIYAFKYTCHSVKHSGKNWMYFETGVRDFAVARSLDLSLYTGTHGVGCLLFVTTIIIEILI